MIFASASPDSIPPVLLAPLVVVTCAVLAWQAIRDYRKQS